jgi:hypothetical protein
MDYGIYYQNGFYYNVHKLLVDKTTSKVFTFRFGSGDVSVTKIDATTGA